MSDPVRKIPKLKLYFFQEPPLGGQTPLILPALVCGPAVHVHMRSLRIP